MRISNNSIIDYILYFSVGMFFIFIFGNNYLGDRHAAYLFSIIYILLICYSFVKKITFKTFFLLLISYIVFGILSFYADIEWFYHDPPENISINYIIITMIGGIIFVSPIILSMVVNHFIMKRQRTTDR